MLRFSGWRGYGKFQGVEIQYGQYIKNKGEYGMRWGWRVMYVGSVVMGLVKFC